MNNVGSWLASLAVVLAAVLVTSSRVTADVITLDAVADVFVKGDNTIDDGSTIVVKHDWDASPYTRKGYVRFDLSGVDLSQVTEATFRVTLASGVSADDTLCLLGLQDALATNSYGRLGDVAWDESDMLALAHHYLAPANSDDEGNYVEDGVGVVGFYGPNVWPANTVLGTAAIPNGDAAGTVYSISTTNLRDLVKADTNGTLTLMLIPEAESARSLNFAAREHSTYAPPQLELTTVPEPGTWGLAVFGLVGLVTITKLRRRCG